MERHVIAGPSSNLERSAKGLTALVYLIGLTETAKIWLAEQLRRDELTRLINQDEDFGGKIAERWLSNVRSKSRILDLKVS